MKEIIELLENDHKIIADKIADLKRLMSLDPETSFSQIATDLAFFQDFTFKGHHLREDEILYTWMRLQNPKSDTAVMDRIKNEHTHLEKLGTKILISVQNYQKNTPDSSIVTIISNLNDFINLYIEHMEKEEKFIFMIAEGLRLSKNEKKAMLKKMQSSLKDAQQTTLDSPTK